MGCVIDAALTDELRVTALVAHVEAQEFPRGAGRRGPHGRWWKSVVIPPVRSKGCSDVPIPGVCGNS